VVSDLNKSITARLHGDDYQRLFFWFMAFKMFHKDTCIEKVAYESDYVKSFDDIVVYYKEDKKCLDCRNNPLEIDFFQVKYHVTNNNSFTWDNLMEPAFINASSISLMKRLRDAQKKCVEKGIQARFNFVSPLNIHPDDKLSELVSNQEYEIRIDKLFDDRPRTKMAKMRKKMTDHLDLSTDEELKDILMSFRIWHSFSSHNFLKDSLNYYLCVFGFKTIDDSTVLDNYLELVKKWNNSGITEFTKDSIIELCKRENLYLGAPFPDSDYVDVGIRSFYIGAENLQDVTENLLSLLNYFNGRFLKNDYSWDRDIFNELNGFKQELSQNYKYRIHLDTHLSIAFVSGTLFASRSGIEIYPMQKTGYRKEFWFPIESNNKIYPDWKETTKVLSEDAKDVALVLGITHDILNDVEEFIEEKNLEISKIISCNVDGNTRNDAIIDGTHANELAISLSTVLKDKRDSKEKKNVLHIFAACPVGFMFYLGKLSRSFGKIILYEHDLEGISEDIYYSSFQLPLII